MENMRFKVGDHVRIKSIDWYNENKDEFGNIRYKRDGSAYPVFFSKYMSNFCGEILTIKSVFKHSYHMNETSSCEFWTDEMIEGLVEEEVGLDKAGQITDFEYEGLAYTLPEGYQFKDENGNVINATKIVLEKKKKEYPKTYEECCKVLGVNPYNFLTIRNVHCYDGEEETIKYERDLLDKFDSLWELLIRRDAYWKIAGEEMGLGKPWEPNWQDDTTHKFIIHTIKDKIHCGVSLIKNHLLAFPTEEMRDAFKENFDTDIEICKEFL